jgi:hypothetical protein
MKHSVTAPLGPPSRATVAPRLARSRRDHIGRDRGQIAHPVYGDDPNGVPSHTQEDLHNEEVATCYCCTIDEPAAYLCLRRVRRRRKFSRRRQLRTRRWWLPRRARPDHRRNSCPARHRRNLAVEEVAQELNAVIARRSRVSGLRRSVSNSSGLFIWTARTTDILMSRKFHARLVAPSTRGDQHGSHLKLQFSSRAAGVCHQ